MNKRLFRIFGLILLILFIPFIAMQFTDEVKWSLFDFLLAGVLLMVIGIIYELVMRKVKTKRNRIIICIGLFLAFVITWLELAVGIFGTPWSGS